MDSKASNLESSLDSRETSCEALEAVVAEVEARRCSMAERMSGVTAGGVFAGPRRDIESRTSKLARSALWLCWKKNDQN